MELVILHSAVAAEARQDDLETLATADAAARVFKSQGHGVRLVPFHLNMADVAERLRPAPDVVLNLVESVANEGRLLHLAPALLEHLGLPFTGSGTEALFTSTNKLLAKRLLSQSGIPTPAWRTPDDPVPVPDAPLPGQYIVKSVWEHASLGLEEDSILDAPGAARLRAEMERRRPQLGQCFAERFVHGREFNVSILEQDQGPVVLPVAEIEFPGFEPGRARLVGYRAKWDETSFEYGHTVRRYDFPASDAPVLSSLRERSQAAWRAFGLSGYARFDFRVDENGAPYLIDVNANPSLAPDAGLAAAGARAGLEYGEVLASIVRVALASGARDTYARKPA